MPKLIRIRTSTELKKMNLSTVRGVYESLANEHKKMRDFKLLLCPKCGDFKNQSEYYAHNSYVTQRFPVCKECLYKMAQQVENEYDEPNETKESVQRVLEFMNKPYDNAYYEDCVEKWKEGNYDNERKSPFSLYIIGVQALPQYKGLTWSDSTFGSDGSFIEMKKRKPRKQILEIFGSGYSTDDYLYLQDQYDDWKKRVEINTKSQETYLVQICKQLLDIDKARLNNRDTSGRLKTLDVLMKSANLQPIQNLANASTDGRTFGQLIELWEEDKPIPEPEEEFKDVDGIGKYLRVWLGWIAKAVGIKNVYTEEYEEEIKKYTATKPAVDENNNSSAIFNKLFGGDKDG